MQTSNSFMFYYSSYFVALLYSSLSLCIFIHSFWFSHCAVAFFFLYHFSIVVFEQHWFVVSFVSFFFPFTLMPPQHVLACAHPFARRSSLILRALNHGLVNVKPCHQYIFFLLPSTKRYRGRKRERETEIQRYWIFHYMLHSVGD